MNKYQAILTTVPIKVLIDTWWNVNLTEKVKKVSVSMVLIDTWWNVNVVVLGKIRFYQSVLIDTWWNVNG